jgi:hypothetical protein
MELSGRAPARQQSKLGEAPNIKANERFAVHQLMLGK